MSTLTLSKIKKAERSLAELHKTLDTERANRMFKCVCGGKHRIRSCDAIQTHYENPNTGSPNGSYYEEGCIFIICPKTGVSNRVLLENSMTTDHFRVLYSKLFKSIKSNYDKHHENWENNYYFQKNLKKFDF